MKVIKLVLVIIILLFGILAASSYLKDIRHDDAIIDTPVIDEEALKALEEYRANLEAEFMVYYDQNQDYVGWLAFNSGIISEPVMDSNDHEKYLRSNFLLEKDDEGTVFVDMDADVDSRNITLYGHYVYYDETAKFSPLHLLKEEKNYSKHKDITLKLKNEIREYEVFAVYYYDWENDISYVYNTADFQTEEGFLRHVRRAKERSMYQTDVEVDGDDNLLTLQTCVRNRDDLRLIVVAKETKRK